MDICECIVVVAGVEQCEEEGNVDDDDQCDSDGYKDDNDQPQQQCPLAPHPTVPGDSSK